MSDVEDSRTYSDILETQRKEKKELTAQTQKMKHSVSKGDKKRKKEVTVEITEMLANMELKHEKELRDFKVQSSAVENTSTLSDTSPCIAANSNENNSNDLNVCLEDIEEKSEITPHKSSKAQRRRNKKAQSEKDREKAIAEQEILNESGLRHIEIMEINKRLSLRNLTIHEVPSDGNCLYKAVEHQLSSQNLQETSVIELREATSKFLLSHKEDYINFLTDPNTGDILSDEQYVKYCDDIVQTCAWGGHVEIQALANVCKRPIEVIQATGPSVMAGDENIIPKLLISYHRHAYGLGEHYNSVIPKVVDAKTVEDF